MTAVADATRPAVWGNTEAYEAYMGRWSRLAVTANAATAGSPIPAAATASAVGAGVP